MARLFQSVRGLLAALLFVVTTVAAAAQDTPQTSPSCRTPISPASTIRPSRTRRSMPARRPAPTTASAAPSPSTRRPSGASSSPRLARRPRSRAPPPARPTTTDADASRRPAQVELPFPAERPRLLRPPASRPTCRPPTRCPKARSTPISSQPATTRWPRRTRPPRCSPTARRLRSTTTTPRSGSSSRPSRWSAPRPTAPNAYDLSVLGTNAAMNAFLLSETRDERVNGLSALAYAPRAPRDVARVDRDLPRDPRAQGRRRACRPGSTRSSPSTASASSPTTSTPRPRRPRICAVFSDPLPNADLSEYVVVEGAPQVAVETEQNQICVTGVELRPALQHRAPRRPALGRWRDAAQRRRRSPSSCPTARPSSALPTTPTCCPPVSAAACRSPRSTPRRPTS